MTQVVQSVKVNKTLDGFWQIKKSGVDHVRQERNKIE
jgi:hypothetical protein